jgi:hypothetical protein
MSMRITLGSLAALGLVSGVVVAACSLGLDERLLDRPVDAGGAAETSVDPGPPDAQPDAGARDGGGTCEKDDDCITTDGCLRGRCDVARKACAFDVCRAAACNAGTCDSAARACKDPKPYALRPATFKVGAPASCSRCIAAVHPYVFVGTATGVVAFNLSNPTASAPPAVPIVGLGFVPSSIVTSGSRIFFFAAAVGTATSARVPLAWIDVPRDPFVTELRAVTTLAGWNRPAAEAAFAYARAEGGAIVLTTAAGLPAAALPPSLSERFDLAALPTPVVPGMGPVALSGTRLLVQALDQAGNAAFGFVPNAGTPLVSDAGLSTANLDAGGSLVGAPQVFAQTADGAVLWSFSALTAGATVPNASVRAARTTRLVANASASPDGIATLDVEVYTPNTVPAGTNVVGPLAAVDQDTALVVAMAKESAQQSSVQFVKREPYALVKNADGASRRAVLPVPLASLVGAAGSNGIGYVLANDPVVADQPANASVYVFDPACAP